MIIKLLLLAVVLYVIYFMLFKKTKNISSDIQEDEELMIECPTCSTYISKKEAIISQGKYYCSKECIR